MGKLRVIGPTALNGTLRVRGAKNAALPIIIAAALSDAPVRLDNVPSELGDVRAAIEAMRYVGCDVQLQDGCLQVLGNSINNTTLCPELAARFRYSLLFLGLLVGKCGHAKITMPGGCQLGDRRFDLHLEGLRRLGARVEVTNGTIEVTADRLVGADIDFYLPTTTGTENIMLAACFAEGTTRIRNANTRPEIEDLGQFLRSMGAKVVVRNRVVEVEGRFEPQACSHTIMAGWDEALTYIIAAAIAGGEICVENFTLEHIQSDVAYLRRIGVDVFEWGGNVFVSGKNRGLKAFDLFTAPYPGVNSDIQPLFAALASQCRGESTITDQRFTERFSYVAELKKLGVHIDHYGNCAVVKGPSELRGGRATALDLRCGAALSILALGAQGETLIDNLYQIERGYERLVPRLTALGASVERIDD